MSKIGKNPVAIPQGVEVTVQGGQVQVQGPKGKIARSIPPFVSVNVAEGQVRVVPATDDARAASRMMGLTRSLIQNMVTGVTQGYRTSLDLVGVGYRADVQGRRLNLTVGLSHPIQYSLPEGIDAKVEEKQTRILLDGVDKELVGQTAAVIQRFRPPEPYKGKGIRFTGERIRLKAGKTGVKT